MQNSFTESLSDIILRSNISKNQLVRESDIDRSSFFKILNGTRMPTADQFNRICRKLQLSPSDEKRLRKAYSKMTLGEKKVRLRDQLTDLLWMLEDADEIAALDLVKPVQEPGDNETMICGKHAVFELLTNSVLREVLSDQEPCEVDLFLPLSADDFLKWIISLLKSNIGGSFKIRQLIELPAISPDPDPVVIERFKLTFLCAAANFNSYSGYYYYSNSSMDSHIGVFCSYSLITSDRAILLNERMDKAIVISGRECCDEFRYHLMMARNSACPLIRKVRYRDLSTELSCPISFCYGGKMLLDKQFQDISNIYISPQILVGLMGADHLTSQKREDTVYPKARAEFLKELRKKISVHVFFVDETDIPSARSWYVAVSGKEKLVFGRDESEDCFIISEPGMVSIMACFMESLPESGYLIRNDLAEEMIEGLQSMQVGDDADKPDGWNNDLTQ